MKNIKFLTAALIIIIALVLIGEMYVWHIDSFETDYPHTTMYLQRSVSPQKMVSDIRSASERHGIEVFAVNKNIESLFAEHIIIYATKGAIPIIENRSNVMSGQYSSIFLGNVKITILPFSDIPDISSVESYYMIGADEDIIMFKQSLVNQYAGRYPEFPNANNKSIYYVTVCWSVVFFVLLLLTLYEIAFAKKEIMIRALIGEELSAIVFKHILTDTIFYLSFLFVSMSVLNQYTNVRYGISSTVTCSVIFLLLNSALYLKIYVIDYKKDIATNSSAKSALGTSYILKTTTAILVVLVMSGNISVILQGADFYRQSGFFEERSEYSYLTVSTDDFDETVEINRDLYKTASISNQTLSLVNLGRWGTDADYIYANCGAIDYLSHTIPDIDKVALGEKVYFILSTENAQSKEVNSEMVEIWESYYKGNYEYEIIAYDNNVDVISIENIGKIKSAMIRNPVIILDNTHPSSVDEYWNISYIANSTLYRYSETDWNAYIFDNGLQNELHYSTNVYENYLYQWATVKRNLYAGIILMLLFFAIESVIIKTILRFEYSVNAVELSLKKLLGYTLYERQQKLLLLTFISCAISIVVAVILCYFINIAPISTILIGGFLIMASEVSFIIYNIRRTEKRNIQRILKGEYL